MFHVGDGVDNSSKAGACIDAKSDAHFHCNSQVCIVKWRAEVCARIGEHSRSIGKLLSTANQHPGCTFAASVSWQSQGQQEQPLNNHGSCAPGPV